MRFWLVMFALVVAGGCSPTAPSAVPVGDASNSASPPAPVVLPEQSEPLLNEPTPDAPAPEAKIEESASGTGLKIEILDWDQTQAIVAAHPGQVVVLDMWATYCPPCLKELPGLVALQKKYPQQVHCVSVCLDFDGDETIPPAKLEPEVRPVLERIKADGIQNVLLSTSSADLLKAVGRGSMPIIYVYDPSGKLALVFPDLDKMDEATYEQHITPAVEELLKPAPSN